MTELLNEQIDYLKMDYYQKWIQDATYREHIKELKDGELVIHVDYSENYKNKQQSEIKTGYYAQGQFSLFTVVIYTKQNDDIVCKNYALVTPENDQSCNISFGLNNFILSTMQADYDIKTVKFWSDGCASQFRSQFAFFMLSKFDHSINIEWNYFEANHGKCVVDGIGGTVKLFTLMCLQKQSCHQIPKAVCWVYKWNIARNYCSVCGEWTHGARILIRMPRKSKKKS